MKTPPQLIALVLGGAAVATLVLPACQSTATAASHRPPPQAMAQQTQTGLTFADLQDLANAKRDLFRKPAHQAQAGLRVADLHDLANVK
jgi:hypothetical protein